jgi:hypothetical protein
VLVGTRSLLGEGWDAPCINSLVLASFVGSFVLTNQMRGRAIRTDREDKNKVASIWHLVCITNSSYSGIADLQGLQRRFKTFVGLNSHGKKIENGLSRMRLTYMYDDLFNSRLFSADRSNRDMVARLQNISKISTDWQQVIHSGGESRVVPVVRAPSIKTFQHYHFKNTLKYFVLESVAGATAVSFAVAPNILSSLLQQDVSVVIKWVSITLGAGFFWFLPRFFKSLKLLLKHASVSGSLYQIALALKNSMVSIKLLPADKSVSVFVINDSMGGFDIGLKGGSFYQQSLFADSLDEILNEIQNPRYLVTRSEYGLLGKKTDYHAVPAVFAAKKNRAQIFYTEWQRYLGQSELVYTRIEEGRLLLLRARARSFSTAVKKSSERLDVWQ